MSIDPRDIDDERIELLDELTNQWLDLGAEIEKAKTRREEIAAELIGQLGIGGAHEIMPGVGVQITKPATRFKPLKAVDILTPEQAALCLDEPKISAAKAKLSLHPALYAMCCETDANPGIRAL